MKYRLAPSILSGDFSRLGEQIREVEKAGATDLHFDVMDGHFVPNISFGIPVLKSLRPFTGLFLDAHLMISDPRRYVEPFAAAGADLITFHLEACAGAEVKEGHTETDDSVDPDRVHEEVMATIAAIRAAGKKVGISINPDTKAEALYPYLDQIDLALVMGVYPGFGGQGMIPETLDTSRKLREYIDSHGLDCDLEFDGGVKIDNLDQVIDAGINVIVAGSAVFVGDAYANAAAFLKKLKEAEA